MEKNNRGEGSFDKLDLEGEAETVCVPACVHLCLRTSIGHSICLPPPPCCVLCSGACGTRTLSSHLGILSSEQCATPTGTCNSAASSKNSPNRIRPVYTGNTWLSQGDSNKHLVEERTVLLDNLEQPGFESERNPPHPVESRQNRGLTICPVYEHRNIPLAKKTTFKARWKRHIFFPLCM